MTWAQHNDPDLRVLIKLKIQPWDKQGVINAHPALKKYSLVWYQIQIQELEQEQEPELGRVAPKTRLVLHRPLVPEATRRHFGGA